MKAALELLGRAERVLVLTGAGISAESGIHTFRGEQGLWKNFRPEELATPEAFQRDPRLVWEWYAWRRGLVEQARPNPGHRALARWLRAQRGAARLATQNVDGLHEVAAAEVGPTRTDPSGPILELHGSLFRVRCTACGFEAPHREAVDASALDRLPACTVCGSLLRPAVVWFGEALLADVVNEAFALARGADVALVVGTSSLVHPAAALPRATLESGGSVIEVNPDETPLSPHATLALRAPAGVVLPELLDAS